MKKTGRMQIAGKSPEELWARQFTFGASTSMLWVIKADALARSFEILSKVAEEDCRKESGDPGIHTVPYMLAAFALENLFKGWIIHSGEESIKDGRFALGSHNLVELAGRTSLAFQEGDEVLLERLTAFAVWGGRYPVPMSTDGLLPREFPDGTIAPLTYGCIPRDYVQIRGLLRRARELLPPLSTQPI